MKTSIVIVTYNEEKDIKECLDSLMRQIKKPDEIILVDDGSQDKTLNIASGYPIKIIKLKHKERSRVRNVGWQKSMGDCIVFAEADSVFDKNWILEICNKFKEGAEAVIDRRKMYKPRTFLQRCLDAQFGIRYSDYKPFSAWGFKRSVLEKAGGFNEKLNQSEDRDLGKRLLDMNCRIVLAEKAVQYHKGEPQNIFQYLKRAYIIEKRRVGGYYKIYSKEIPLRKIIGLVVIFILFLFSFFNIFILFIFISLLVLYYVLILYKITVKEKGWGIVKIKYIFGLAFYRILRNIFSVFGFLSGKLLKSNNL